MCLKRLTHYPELEDIFQVVMQQISAQANELLARYVDFTKVKKMVDIGGGNAANLIINDDLVSSVSWSNYQ